MNLITKLLPRSSCIAVPTHFERGNPGKSFKITIDKSQKILSFCEGFFLRQGKELESCSRAVVKGAVKSIPKAPARPGSFDVRVPLRFGAVWPPAAPRGNELVVTGDASHRPPHRRCCSATLSPHGITHGGDVNKNC